MNDSIFEADLARYAKKRNMPLFHRYYRKAQAARFFPIKAFYLCLLKLFRRFNMVELSARVQAGPGLFFGHAYCITINPETIIGSHVNIHKGVTIGQENRGSRKGVPVIGDRVWIGINSTIVGGIKIGNDVMIAPNTFVNCDIPNHSVVIGNPCIIRPKENATEGYYRRLCGNYFRFF